MHWFWRAAIAGTLGVLAGTVLGHPWVRMFSGSSRLDDYIDSIVGRDMTDPLLQAVLMALVAGIAFILLTYMPLPKSEHTETRCRRCGYILRAITEPRCPECGEKI